VAEKEGRKVIYVRSSYVVSSEFDSAFRLLAGSNLVTDFMGSVEEPAGHLSALEIDEEAL
jgi:hypothetical protein